MRAFIITLLVSLSLIAGEIETSTLEQKLSQPEQETPLTHDELMDRVLYTNLIGAGVVTLWGVAFWDYFSIGMRTNNEGWFGADTKYGGSDKLGHMYSTYLWSLGFGSLYESWGMHSNDAAIYGSLTSWTFQAIMEVGDSFSKTEGFSYEDMLMNTLGALFYYARESYPSLKNKLDMRVEYAPNFESGTDFFTQYNSMKYVFALKFSGFDSMKHNFMKYGEFHVGYYTRGYQNQDAYSQRERILYAAVGISIAEIVNATGWEKTSKIFNYYQLPYTYVPFGYDFDSDSYVQPYSRSYFGTK